MAAACSLIFKLDKFSKLTSFRLLSLHQSAHLIAVVVGVLLLECQLSGTFVLAAHVFAASSRSPIINMIMSSSSFTSKHCA